MTKSPYVLLLLLISCGNKQNDGEIRNNQSEILPQNYYLLGSDTSKRILVDYETDSTIRSIIFIDGGKINGKYLEFHKNGSLSLNANYSKGEKVGVHYLYHKNGRIFETEKYIGSGNPPIINYYDSLGNVLK